MATPTSIKETFGSQRRKAKHKSDGREYQRVFIVKMDSIVTDMKDVVTASIDSSNYIPDPGDPYPTDTTARVKSVDPEEIDGTRKHFFVIVKYSTSTSSLTPVDDPVDEPWVINAPNYQTRKRIDKTEIDTSSDFTGTNEEYGVADGEPIATAAGEPYEEGIYEEEFLTLIECIKNIDTSDASIAELETYRGTINNAVITIAGRTAIPKWSCRMIGFSYSKQNTNGKEYYRLTYRFLIKPDLWVRKVLNKGFVYLDGSSAQTPIIIKGQRVQTAQNIINDGTWSSSVTPNYRVFGTIPEADWSGLTITPPTSL